MKNAYLSICLLIISTQLSLAQWTNVTPPSYRHFNGVSILDQQNIVVVGGNQTNDEIQTVITTPDGGNTWDIRQDLIKPWLKAVAFPNSSLGFAVGYRGTILRTSNGGLSWDSLTIPINTSSRDFHGLFFLNANTGYAAGGLQNNDSLPGIDSMQTILKTVNGGDTWVVQHDVPGRCLKSIYFTDNNNGIAVGERGVVLKTTDGGSTWNPVVLSGNMANRNLNSVCFINSNTGFIAGGYPSNDSIQTILKTTDGGDNWNIVKDNIGHMLNAIYFSTGTNGYTVGNKGVGFGTTDGGDNWTALNLPAGGVLDTMDLNAVNFLNADYGMITGRFGKLVQYQNSITTVPVVTTLSASKVGSSSAQLNLRANASGFTTTTSFEYGTSMVFGSNVSTQSSISGNSLLQDSVMLTGLLPNTFYYFRAKGVNQNGTSYGATRQFYTSDCEVPNCDFEVWDTLILNNPRFWNTQGIINKVTSYNNSLAPELGPGEGVVAFADIGNENPSGGYPCTVQPDSIVMYARYNMADTGVVIVFFKLNGTIISQNIFPITGSSGGNFVRLSFPIQFTNATMPDTMLMAVANRNVFSNNQGNPVNIIAVDDVELVGANFTLPNANFELWDTARDVRPVDWFSDAFVKETNAHIIERATDAFTGNYALSLRTLQERHLSIMADDTSNWNLPSFPVAGKHLTLNLYAKFLQQNSDSLLITLSMYKDGTYIGYMLAIIDTPLLDYTPLSFDINYNNQVLIPDSASLIIQVGADAQPGGSLVYIDNISFDGFRLPSGIKRVTDKAFGFSVYPNPGSSMVALMMDKGGFYKIDFCDLTGHLLKTYTTMGRETVIDVSQFPQGIYLVKASKDNATGVKKLVILH